MTIHRNGSELTLNMTVGALPHSPLLPGIITWPQETTTAAADVVEVVENLRQKVVEPAPPCVAELAEQLRQQVAEPLRQRAKQQNQHKDARAVFTYAYEEITRAIIADLANFKNPAWIARLDIAFARYYFWALDAYDQHGNYNDPAAYTQQFRVMQAWKPVFDLISGKPAGLLQFWLRPSVLESLLFGLITHIVHDLPLALRDVGLTDGHGVSHIHDFHRINDVLQQTIDKIQAEISDKYDPSLKWFDDYFGQRYDEILTSYLLRLARGMAWYNATRLLDPDLEFASANSIKAEAQEAVNLINRPSSGFIRLVLFIYRIFSNFCRCWPQE